MTYGDQDSDRITWQYAEIPNFWRALSKLWQLHAIHLVCGQPEPHHPKVLDIHLETNGLPGSTQFDDAESYGKNASLWAEARALEDGFGRTDPPWRGRGTSCARSYILDKTVLVWTRHRHLLLGHSHL